MADPGAQPRQFHSGSPDLKFHVLWPLTDSAVYPPISQTPPGAGLSTMEELPSTTRRGRFAQVLHTYFPEYPENRQFICSDLGYKAIVPAGCWVNLPRQGNLGSSIPILAFSHRIRHALKMECLKLFYYIPSAPCFCLIRQ